MKDEKDDSTIDAFPETRKVGRPKTSSIVQKKELARLRQAKHQQKKRELQKCLQFTVKEIERSTYGKSRSNKIVLQQFLFFLNGGENIQCTVTSSDDHTIGTDFDELKALILSDQDIDRIN